MGHRAAIRGFTLVEVVLALAVTSILLGAMGSLIVIASRVVPDRTRSTDLSISGAADLDLLSAELAQATTIVQGTATSIEFKVPDRDGDGQPEDILYTWSGAGGDLCRILNGGSKVVIASPVSAFALNFSVIATTTASASTIQNVAETQVAGWPSGGLGLLGSLTLASTPIDSSKYIAQNIRATLPANARSWTITHVQVCAKADLLAATGSILIQVKTVDANGQPTSAVITGQTVPESSFSTLAFSVVDVVFANAPPLAPNQEVSIVMTCSANCPAGAAAYSVLSGARSTPMWLDNGAGWTSSNLQVMPHAVFATATTSTPTSVNVKKLGRVSVQLRVGTDSRSDVRTTIDLPNMPGVS